MNAEAEGNVPGAGPRLTRRSVLSSAAGALLAAKAGAEAAEFAFPLLGDLHFDRPEHHAMEWLAREKPNDVRQVESYCRLTRERLPTLFQEVREQVAAAGKPVPFTVHVGDLVEGLCGTPELARKHCEDAVSFLRGARLGAPFLMTKGNHDVTGPGAVEAFNQVLIPFQAGEVRRDLRTASFTVEHGSALFAVFDAYDRGSLDWLERALERRTAKHLFVLVHPPVVPYAARSLWHLYAQPAQQAQRERLLSLLGRNRAIVLCGHLHKYGIVARDAGGGRLVQLSVSSIISQPDVKPKDARSGLAGYGPDLVELEPQFDPKSRDARREALKAEAPFVRYWEYADAPGYAVLRVGPKQVEADLYLGVGKRLWKTVSLSDLLGA